MDVLCANLKLTAFIVVIGLLCGLLFVIGAMIHYYFFSGD